MNSCQIGSLTYTYAFFLQNGRKEADSLFCKLSWLIAAQPTIDSYITVGTKISDPGQNACGLTNTNINFAPVPPLVSFQVTAFTYNGNPLIFPDPQPTLILLMNSIVAALTAASGVQWSYSQISEWEFELCAPYTRNGDTVTITIQVFSEASLGFLNMAVTLSGGIAPETPVRYATDATNCNITASQHEQMVETANWITRGVKCCDIKKPEKCVPEIIVTMPLNLELREGNPSIEEREGG